MIVKIQRSIVSTNGLQNILIYNQDRSLIYESQMSSEVQKLFDSEGCPLKLYCNANLENGILEIGKVIHLQDW